MKLGQKPDAFEVSVQFPISKNCEMTHVIFATDLPQDCFFTQEVRLPAGVSPGVSASGS